MSRLARNTDPVTSHAAAAEVVATGKASLQRQAAFEAVSIWPGRSSMVLSRLCGLDRYQLARRLPELEFSGRVYREGVCRDPDTGRSGVRWWPVEEAAA